VPKKEEGEGGLVTSLVVTQLISWKQREPKLKPVGKSGLPGKPNASVYQHGFLSRNLAAIFV